MADPVEVTTRYATTVDDLASAWAFVMERVDRFEVVVSGMVEGAR